ncbi:VOC family protein [Chloroflexota bacterium]
MRLRELSITLAIGLILFGACAAPSTPIVPAETPPTEPMPTPSTPPAPTPIPSLPVFGTPKKSPHWESNTPGHESMLAAVPINVVIDFNFDLGPGSAISITNDGKEYATGDTIIDDNKLTNAPITPTLPVVDLARAKKFYEEKLGLKVIKEDASPGAILQAGSGTKLYIYQRGATKADHTVANFTVSDVEGTVKELKAKGVVFEDIKIPGIETIDGIANMGDVKGAWFKDTEGNILGVANM